MSASGPLAASPAWGVSALLLAVSDSLAARFGAVRVQGELSGFVRAASGHCYFSLKDHGGGAGLVRCAMFRRAAGMLEVLPAEGQVVEIRGRLAVYEPRGELQMVVESLQRVGTGSLYEEFLRLRARLGAQGLFDEARRRRLPPHPRRIGVITSPDAAAWRDVMTALARRAPHVQVVLYPSLVQGAQAPAELLAALVTAAQRREVDVLLLVRGGGSLEDLWAFNDERVVRAVAASPIPLVCGVGHESDVTLCDLAADLRAATPTAAAELAAPARTELLAQLDGLAARLQRRLEREAQRIDLAAHRAGRPAVVLGVQAQRLLALGACLDVEIRRTVRVRGERLPLLQHRLQATGLPPLRQRAERLEGLAQRLQAAHPQQVLARGFVWMVDERQQPLMRVASLEAGQAVQAVFADGRAALRVQSVGLPPVADAQALPAKRDA